MDFTFHLRAVEFRRPCIEWFIVLSLKFPPGEVFFLRIKAHNSGGKKGPESKPMHYCNHRNENAVLLLREAGNGTLRANEAEE